MSCVGRVVVVVPGMGGGYDEPETWDQQYDTYEEANAFVEYWRNFKSMTARDGGNGIIFIEGEVVEYD